MCSSSFLASGQAQRRHPFQFGHDLGILLFEIGRQLVELALPLVRLAVALIDALQLLIQVFAFAGQALLFPLPFGAALSGLGFGHITHSNGFVFGRQFDLFHLDLRLFQQARLFGRHIALARI